MASIFSSLRGRLKKKPEPVSTATRTGPPKRGTDAPKMGSRGGRSQGHRRGKKGEGKKTRGSRMSRSRNKGQRGEEMSQGRRRGPRKRGEVAAPPAVSRRAEGVAPGERKLNTGRPQRPTIGIGQRKKERVRSLAQRIGRRAF